LIDASKWQVVLESTDVFKTYINVLQGKPNPGKTIPQLSNAQLQRLVQFTQDHNLKVAFEVGGLRTSAKVCGSEAGEILAQREFALLKRWLNAGGRIDYLTTDHAVMMNMRGVGFAGPGLNPDRECKMTVRELTDELADYFQVMHREIPTARFGVIESLGYFRVQGTDGEGYMQSDPKLPDWLFSDYFDYLLEAMKHRDLKLDHFHIDFGFRGVSYDGRRWGDGRLNFGRVLAVEAYVQLKGVKSGVIFNATLDKNANPPERETSNREVYLRTLRLFNEYIGASGKADHIVLQTWGAYPDCTGPEDKAFTFFNIARDIMHSERQAQMQVHPAATQRSRNRRGTMTESGVRKCVVND
jgi:hypothetical protein